MDKDFVASNGFSVRVNDDGSMQIDNVYVGPEHMAAFVEWSERQEVRVDDPPESAQQALPVRIEAKVRPVGESPEPPDDNEEIREALAQVIRENRSIAKIMGDGYVSVMQADDNEIADAILASDVWRNRRQGPITPPSDDDREALWKVLLTQFAYAEDDPGVADLREAILAAGFRRQGPITDEGPARIVQMPPSPETSARYWESHCPVCTTHEGMYRYANDERLIALRDEHNARHREAPLPGPINEEAVVAAATALAGMPWENMSGRAYWIDEARAALEAAERVRSTVPCVECSGTGWLATHQRDGSATADSCGNCGGSGLIPRAAVPSTTDEWEYGRITKTQWHNPRMRDHSVQVLADTPGNIEYQRSNGYMIVRRRKAGPWEAVPSTTEQEKP